MVRQHVPAWNDGTSGIGRGLGNSLVVIGGRMSAAVGLLHRRRKWHLAEHNRILASLDRLHSEAARLALESHRAAIAEIDAIGNWREPEWGPEEEETRKYLEHSPAETVQEQESPQPE